MKKYARALFVLIIILSVFIPKYTYSDVIEPLFDVLSEFPDIPPTIDGVASVSEWAHIDTYDIEKGYLRLQNDASYLYILLDITDDTVDDQPTPDGSDVIDPTLGDQFSLVFDVDFDGDISVSDLIYSLILDSMHLGVGNILGGTSLVRSEYSQLGIGFGASPSSSTPHRIWELAISLSEVGAQPNGLVRLGVGIYSDNPSILFSYPADMSSDFSNLIDVALVTMDIDLLILCDESFLDALIPLKKHKNETGIITYVQSWQSLNQSMPGYDAPERLKWGIHQYRLNCKIIYVMLVGDCDKLPVRYVKGYGYQGGVNYLPSDLYYADLYDSSLVFDDWDYDNDHAYGEFDYQGGTDITKVNLDKIDMHPNVMVGRVPASTVGEVKTYVDKVIGYELSATSSTWFKRALYIVDGGTGAFGDETKKNQIDSYLSGFSITKAYQDYSPWDTMEYEDRAASINDYLRDGLGFVNWFGHGNPTFWDPWYHENKIQVAFSYNSSWHPFFYAGEVIDVGDFNGDGIDDLVTFVRDAESEPGKGNVYVSLSTGSGFGALQKWHDDFCTGDQVPRIGDFNGDGKDDIVYFHQGVTGDPEFGDVYVALSTGSSFGSKVLWHTYFSKGQEVPRVGDVNGDGKDDIITFIKSTKTDSGRGDVYVALSTGTGFGAGQKWHDMFGLGSEVPDIGDFDGDGKDDIIVFIQSTKSGSGAGDVYVSLSSGTSFGATKTWHGYFSLGNELPGVGDIDGDGTSDILTFIRDSKAPPADGGVYASLSNGAQFGSGIAIKDDFAADGGIVRVGDFDGDGFDDIVAFEDVSVGLYGEVTVSTSSPSRNEDMLPVVFALSCSTGRFHFDSNFYLDVNDDEWDGSGVTNPAPNPLQLSKYDRESWAENMLVKYDVGAIGYVGAAEGYEYGGELLDKYFFEAYHVGWKPPTLGFMWSRAMDEFVTNKVEPDAQDYYAFIHIHKVLLFGDPSLRVGGLPYLVVKIPSGGFEYSAAFRTNSHISELGYQELSEQIIFTVEGQMDRIGFCNVTIPLTLLAPIVIDPVLYDGQPVQSQVTQNQTHSFVYFTYPHSAHQITILGYDLGPTAEFDWSPKPQDEGLSVVFSDLSTSSPDAIVSWSWDFGDTGSSSNQNPSHTYLDNGAYTVTLTVNDDDGSTDSISHTVLVNNVAPSATATGDTINENEYATVRGSISDPGILDYFDVTIDWGDGFSETISYPAGSTSYSVTYQYLDDEPSGTLSDVYTVTVTVTDDDGGSGVAGTSVQVNNVDPVTDAGPDQTVNVGDTVSFSGSFSDQGMEDTHTAVWDWGDGSPPEPGTVTESGGSGTVAGSHVYLAYDVYVATLTVTDDDTGRHSDTVTITVLPYSIVTDSSLYPNFDREPDTDGTQFRLIFSPDLENDPLLYKISATNPGQFYYNVFHVGDVVSGESFEVDVPYPFITKGANPVHVYDDVEVFGSGCYSYSVANDITHQFEIAYSSSTITITPEVSLSGVTWITMHLDYGLKKTGGYEMHLYKDNVDIWRAHAMKNSGSIYDLTDYVFTVSGPVSDSQTIQNRNEFKKIRGIAGQITGAGAGVEVSIFGGSIDTIVLTDDDGWYGLEFKHKGKAAGYTINPTGYDPKTIILKPAHFAEVNFDS